MSDFQSELREILADQEHATWASWQKWMHSTCTKDDGGNLILTSELVRRWDRQIATPFADLPENEKASDYAEVDKILPAILQLIKEARREELERLKQFNGSIIHDCGRRVNKIIHHSLIDDRLAQLKEQPK